MAIWQFLYEDVDIGVPSFRNVVGSPLVGAYMVTYRTAGANLPPAGVYRFTMEDYNLVSISAQHYGDLKSPALYSGTVGVLADGATGNLGLLPGVYMVLSDTAVAEDIFEVGIGCYWDSENGVWLRILPFDTAISSMETLAKRITLKNVSGSPQCNCTIYATNAIYLSNTQSAIRPFLSFRQVGGGNPTAHEDLTGVTISFTDFIPGSPNLASILVDGSPIDVYDITNETYIANGEYLECDGSTIYKFADGTALESGEFILSASLAVTDTATIWVSDGGDFVQLANDTGDYVTGPTGITLTGESAPDGTVDEDEEVSFRIKLLSPSGKTREMNQRLFSVRAYSESI